MHMEMLATTEVPMRPEVLVRAKVLPAAKVALANLHEVRNLDVYRLQTG